MDLLTALATFVRVAETGSFSAVARQTNTSHSAVTRLVGYLEEQFGVRLFQRSTRRINLTEDGQSLLGYARQLLETTEEMQGVVGRQRSSPTGVVRLAIPVAASPWLVPRLPDFVERYPGLTVELVVADGFGDMIADRIDVAMLGWQPPEGAMIARKIGTYARVLVTTPGYLQRHKAPAHPGDLVNHTCVVHERGGGPTSWQFGGPDGEFEVEVSGGIRANNSEAIHTAVLCGYGIAQLPGITAFDDLNAGRLCRLLADFDPPREQIYLVYPTRRHLPPRVRVVIDYLAENMRRLNAHLAEASVSGETEGV